MKNRLLEKIFDLLIVICSIVSLVFISGVLDGNIVWSRFASLLSIYTIFAIIYYLLECVYIWNRKHGVFFSLLKFILVTGITFSALFTWIFLQPFYKNSTGWLSYGYTLIHVVLPILITLEYLVSHKGHFNKKFIVMHMFTFMLYGIVSVLCGMLANTGYPYAFLDSEQLGYDIVIKECFLIVVVMYIYGKIILMIDGIFKKRKRV